MSKIEDLILIQRLYFSVNDEGVWCQMQENALIDDLKEEAFFILRFPVSEKPITWFVGYGVEDNDSNYINFPVVRIYDIKGIKIKDFELVNNLKEDFSLDFCTNEKQNKLFLNFTATKKYYCLDIRDISNIKIGEEIKFNLQGKYYTLSLTVKIYDR